MRTSGCACWNFGDHAGDQRVHEERHAAEAHDAGLALAEVGHQFRGFSRCREHDLAWIGQRAAERGRLKGRRPLWKSGSPRRFSSIASVRETGRLGQSQQSPRLR